MSMSMSVSMSMYMSVYVYVCVCVYVYEYTHRRSAMSRDARHAGVCPFTLSHIVTLPSPRSIPNPPPPRGTRVMPKESRNALDGAMRTGSR